MRTNAAALQLPPPSLSPLLSDRHFRKSSIHVLLVGQFTICVAVSFNMLKDSGIVAIIKKFVCILLHDFEGEYSICYINTSRNGNNTT